ncbi:hypothetical protein SLS55_003892 [Diplodia seriata]|uniref:Uncharacterized protein n=1 Tax=Diplodia seriata TaxID=420778 RepID=A0ABR3CHW3_9PEZI
MEHNLRDVPNIMVPLRAAQVSSYGFSVTASSIAILLIPVIKIVAAGLYSVTLATTTEQVQPSIDTSIVSNLESTYDLGGSYLSVQRASQFAEWSRTPSFNVPRRAGILDNLVFSNITSPGHLRDDIDLTNSTIDVEVPAISVDVNCTDADMSIWAQYTDSTDCWTFHADCASQQCKDLIPVDDEPGTYYLDGNSGGSCPGSNDTFVGMTAFGPSAYRVLLADYTSVKQQPFTNTTPWGTTKAYKSYNLTTGFLLAPDALTVALPTLRAVSCALSLAEVSVRTTYAYSAPSSTWTPRAYDPHSIAPVRAYNASASLPSWLRPYAYASNGSALLDLHDLTLAAPGRLASSSSSLWPTRGAALNFFELLAAHAEYDLRRNNASALLLDDRRAFNDAVSDMVVAYTVEMLTEMRPFAAAAAGGGGGGGADTTRRNGNGTGTAPGSATAPGNGTITFFAPRIMQSPQATYALVALLAAVAGCFAWVFARFPATALLPKGPGSVAARMGWLAGGRLVGGLRGGKDGGCGGGVGRERERAGLGWWPAPGLGPGGMEMAEAEADGEGGLRRRRTRTWRWGIDVGEGVVQRDWRHAPVDGSVEGLVDVDGGGGVEMRAVLAAGPEESVSLVSGSSAGEEPERLLARSRRSSWVITEEEEEESGSSSVMQTPPER